MLKLEFLCSSHIKSLLIQDIHVCKTKNMKHSIFILITVLFVRPNRQSDLEASKKLQHISKEWISKIPQLIEEAAAKFKKEGSKTTVERVSFGWSIVAGSILDSLSSYIKEKTDDNLKEGVYENDKVLHMYSHLLSYGVGFGFPWLLTLPGKSYFIQ